MKTLILGIGNPILSDDGVGIEIARCIERASLDVMVEETHEAAIALLDLITDCERLIIIDSIVTAGGRPGELYKLDLEDFTPRMDVMSAHSMDIATAFEVGRHMGCCLPRSVSIYAVEVKDNTTLGEGCTPELAVKIAPIAQQIIAEDKL